MKTTNQFARFSHFLTFPLSHFPAFPLSRFLALLAASLALHPARAADPIIETFQKALFEEEANQNYEAAIRAYTEVVGKLDDQRKLAATALFRLGECYRKLGRTNDAVASYQRVMIEFPDQARLVDLSRTYVLAAAPAQPGSERVLLLERQIVELEAEQARLDTLLTQLKKLPRAELTRAIPTAAPDTALNRLLEERRNVEQKLAGITSNLSINHPDVKGFTDTAAVLERQIDERVDGILGGMEAKVSSIKARLDVLRQQLAEAQRAAFAMQKGSGPVPGLPPDDRAKLKDLLQQELRIAERFLAEQKQQVKVGRAALGDEARFERDVLGLKRQLLAVDGLTDPDVRSQWRALLLEEIKLAEKAAQLEKAKLDVGRTIPSEVARLQRDVLALKREMITFDATPASQPLEASQTALGIRLQGTVERASASAVSDEEEKEIRRIRALIQDSPDLINARSTVGLTPGLAPLHIAAGAGYARVVRFLLESGADPNLKAVGQNNGLSALHSAARNGHKSVVDLLLDAKADPAARDGSANTPLHLAAMQGYRLIVERFIGAGVPINARNSAGMTPLHNAVAAGHQSIIELLFKKGADLNVPATANFSSSGVSISEGYTPVHTAIAADQIALVRWLNTNGANVNAPAGPDRITPLHLAARNNNADAIRALIRGGLDLDAGDANEQTPLLYAVGGGKLSAAELLLDAGANPNGRPGAGSPLLHSVRESEDMLRLLITHKADLDVTNRSGRTLLFSLVENVPYPTNFITLLLDAGANPNAGMANGYVPLHAAAVRANPEVTALLLRHGADVNATTSDGATPLYNARTATHPWRTGDRVEQTVALLLASGADETLQRLRSISVSRRTRGFEASVFTKGTNDFNRHSLFELVATFFQSVSGRAPVLPFPDLQHFVINRALGGGRTTETNLDVEARLAVPGCAGDFWLEWGDVVEIPELDHPLPATWEGFSENFARPLGECVSRKFNIVIKGRTNLYELEPRFLNNVFSLPSFRLQDVLASSGLLLTSSDRTRVRVSRHDPITNEPREWMLDTTKLSGANDLWLRHGDVIEVPDRPPGGRVTAPPVAQPRGIPQPPPGQAFPIPQRP